MGGLFITFNLDIHPANFNFMPLFKNSLGYATTFSHFSFLSAFSHESSVRTTEPDLAHCLVSTRVLAQDGNISQHRFVTEKTLKSMVI